MLCRCLGSRFFEEGLSKVEQLRIRRCKLHIRRHGGWSWGADPNHLVRRATQALPELIANRLKNLLVDHNEPMTIGRLCITIPLKMSELISLPLEPGRDIVNSVLSDRISWRCQQALAVQAGIDLSESVVSPTAKPPEQSSRVLPVLVIKNDGISLLREWYQQGKLLQLLRDFSDQARNDWGKLALRSLPENITEKANQQDLLKEAEQFSLTILQSLKKQTSVSLKRLVLLTALLQRFPNLFSRGIITDLLNKSIPDDPSSGATPVRQYAETDPTVELSTPPRTDDVDNLALSVQKPTKVAKKAGRRTNQSFEVHVSSVLPFVSAGILSRLGYFDVLATALHAGEVDTDIHNFAVALAYKMLAPPQRGWHWEATDLRTAAAVAGLQESICSEDIDRFAYSCRHCLTPLDSYVKRLLIEGHEPSQALLIHQLIVRDQPHWLLMDCQGCFPLGWYVTQEMLLQALEDFSGNTFLISGTMSQPSLFAELSARRHRFVTTLLPSRRDKWRPVDRQRRFWTNDMDAQTRWMLNQCQCLPAVTATANEMTRELIVDRPVVPTQSQHPYMMQFEQSLALAASSALGTVAWKLWGENEATDPVLALQRLGNLEGKVFIDSEKITVRPALGRRYYDLYQHNFLVDVVNIPWLGGRRMEFSGL